MALDDIGRTHVDRAAQEFRKLGGIGPFLKKFKMDGRSRSRSAFVILGGKLIDAKAIVRAAHFFTNHKEILPADYKFYGGKSVISFLQKLGYSEFMYRGKAIGNPAEYSSSEIGQNSGPSYALRIIEQRLGQKKFRNALMKTYENQCAITGCQLTAILEAAHISPFSESTDHDHRNGILLRSDIHTLFDLGLLWIDPKDFTVVLDESLIATEYYIYNGKKIRLPENKLHWPDKARLKEKIAARKNG